MCRCGDEIVECAIDAFRLERLDLLDDTFCPFDVALPVVTQHVAHRVLNLRPERQVGPRPSMTAGFYEKARKTVLRVLSQRLAVVRARLQMMQEQPFYFRRKDDRWRRGNEGRMDRERSMFVLLEVATCSSGP